MNKIIAIAALGLAVTACDPYEDEPGGTPQVTQVIVSGRLNAASGGPWVADAPDTTDVWRPVAAEAPINPTPATAMGTATARGRFVVVKTNVLLDGTSIEQEPQTCIPATATTLTVTSPAMPAGGQWYTCYFPGTPTALEGASVFVYYSLLAPGVLSGQAPTFAGELVVGDYAMTVQFKSKSGADLSANIAFTVAPAT